jgi:hypothetical protein
MPAQRNGATFERAVSLSAQLGDLHAEVFSHRGKVTRPRHDEATAHQLHLVE